MIILAKQCVAASQFDPFDLGQYMAQHVLIERTKYIGEPVDQHAVMGC